jgi:hypothetical protein
MEAKLEMLTSSIGKKINSLKELFPFSKRWLRPAAVDDHR